MGLLEHILNRRRRKWRREDKVESVSGSSLRADSQDIVIKQISMLSLYLYTHIITLNGQPSCGKTMSCLVTVRKKVFLHNPR